MFVLHEQLLVSDYTITLHLKRPDGTVLVKAATDLGGSKGQFQFAAGDLQAGLQQLAEVQSVNIATSRPQTSTKFFIDVEEELA